MPTTSGGTSRLGISLAVLILALSTGAATAQTAESYSYVGHSAGVLVTPFHVDTGVTGNWACASNNPRLDTDGSGTVETSECYINVGDYDFSATCTGGGAHTSPVMDYGFNGDKPARFGSYVYHFVQANNFSERNGGAVAPVGPAAELDNGGDEFWIFRCSIDDPLCQSSSPELVNASPRPDNHECGSGNPTTDPTCTRYSWQLKAVNEFPTAYNKLDVWVKLQDQGLEYFHTNVNQTGQPPGTKEFLIKPALVVMNRTTNPYAINEAWDSIDKPRPAGSGYETVLLWNADTRWCDGTYDYSLPPGESCPNKQLEARITDFVVERRVATVKLPIIDGSSPASGSCTTGPGGCTLGDVQVDHVGFLNYQVDTDRQAAGDNGGLCLVSGVLDICPAGQTPLVPASCSDPLNTHPACKPVHGCNCCEPSNQGLCTNKFLENKASFVLVDARKTVFFPRYNSGGWKILGWSWVKWGEWLDVVPPEHPGISRRTPTLHLAPTPAGNRWEFWQMTGAQNDHTLPGDVDPGPFEVPACVADPVTGALPSPPFPKSNQDLDGDGQPLRKAWMCSQNVGTVNESTLEGNLQTVRYGFFNPTTGVISGWKDTKANLHTFDFVNPYMPNFYKGGAVTWASGVLDLKKCPTCPRYRVFFWGTRANHICSVVNKTAFKIPGTQIVWERFEIPGYE